MEEKNNKNVLKRIDFLYNRKKLVLQELNGYQTELKNFKNGLKDGRGYHFYNRFYPFLNYKIKILNSKLVKINCNIDFLLKQL